MNSGRSCATVQITVDHCTTVISVLFKVRNEAYDRRSASNGRQKVATTKMKSSVIFVIAVLIIGFGSSCDRKAPLTLYDNGYFAAETRLSDAAHRWQLWRNVRGQSGLVSEVIVADGMVLSFMPSVISPSQTWQKDEATYVSNYFAVAHVSNGISLRYRLEQQRNLVTKREEDVVRISSGNCMSSTAFSNYIERVCGFSTNCSVVLEIKTPCNFDLLKRTIESLARISGSCLVLQPLSQHVMTWEEMADTVDAARYREAKEGPDIPVFLPDEPPSIVKRDFYLACASHSTTNLENFISRHNDDRSWSGKAQIEIGNLFQRRGQHEKAICAYESAIQNYGTSTVPEKATSITVADLANAERTRCLKTMGRIPKAISNQNEVRNLHIDD